MCSPAHTYTFQPSHRICLNAPSICLIRCERVCAFFEFFPTEKAPTLCPPVFGTLIRFHQIQKKACVDDTLLSVEALLSQRKRQNEQTRWSKLSGADADRHPQ